MAIFGWNAAFGVKRKDNGSQKETRGSMHRHEAPKPDRRRQWKGGREPLALAAWAEQTQIFIQLSVRATRQLADPKD